MRTPALAPVAALVAALGVLLGACTGGGSPEPAAQSSGAQSSGAQSSGAPASGSPASDGSSSAPTDGSAQVVQRPRRGACYRLSLREAARTTSDAPPVPCTRRATAITIAVGRIDDLVSRPAVPVDSALVQRRLARRCPAELRRFVGGGREDLRLSRFQVVWFRPTVAQADAGARWFRCDLVVLGKGDSLLPLPANRRLRDVLDRSGALDTFGLCGTARPGARGFTRVACALRHSWRAISAIPLKGGLRYPGAKKVSAEGQDACAAKVRAQSGLPLRFSYGWEWPTRDQWLAGQHYGYCWAPTSG